MKKAVVLGASGGMGYALVKELSGRGIETVAFARSEQKMKALFQTDEHVKIITGDAQNNSDILKACEGATHLFHTISVPYPLWEELHPKLMVNILDVAKEKQSKVVVIDNIYAYGYGNGEKVGEDFPKNPHTKKGKIRLEIEKMGKEAHKKGTPVLFAHFPDFYGPNAANTILNFTIEAMVKNKSALFIGNQNYKREYIYTPDGAKAAVELSLREDSYGHNWNIPGCGVITGKEIINILRGITNNKKRVWTIKTPIISMMGLFDKIMREVKEMMYLTEEPVVLSGSKYQSRIGEIPATPYKVGLEETVKNIKNQ